jgi:EAL domain-containing protein (putative c-di-GMP-specific phosphodiesterase class I)
VAQGYLFSKPLPIEEMKTHYHEIGQIVERIKPDGSSS